MQQAEAGKQELAERETACRNRSAHQRAAEAALEKLRRSQAEASEALSVVQGEVYEVASEIARLEQKIEHNRELQQRQRKEFDEISASLKDLEQHMLLDQAQVSDLTSRLAGYEPALAEAEREEAAADAERSAAEAAVRSGRSR